MESSALLPDYNCFFFLIPQHQGMDVFLILYVPFVLIIPVGLAATAPSDWTLGKRVLIALLYLGLMILFYVLIIY